MSGLLSYVVQHPKRCEAAKPWTIDMPSVPEPLTRETMKCES